LAIANLKDLCYDSRMKRLPPFLKKYFWDVDFEKLNPHKYPYFVIERILEYGDDKPAKWMLRHFNRAELKQTLSKRRGISRRSANYWALILGIPKNQILCLKKQYQSNLQKTWPY